MGRGSERLPEGATHERRGLGVRASHIFLRKLRRDSILSEQHSKINKTLETTSCLLPLQVQYVARIR